ncbi:hypothetical protein J2Q11_03025 [Tenacibaculum finnmarkense genomovar finnmarkense]|uniref:Cap15 family cyclic dinucleotide receptor domain-containing protein n=1 Tax=Tenacibaculum finnmarkense TaxID=2781243 RepID=UPI001E35BADC|nr:hypothetical protein [Tenacibaculum finnmarkense]MCD8416390.1 hypothetical protein [Tenacibaculum finnmarkense genomovar finnmarkense]MCG8185050.1 hypothetical protein [Tenacibaculum finnmarkense genomovar finnmarkense]MCG8201116.1 hypothetical protein [Tenacibaculum finnmarkense genomovar finnmarkense]MCG8209009.1 hypothetical protein [Tenacibaculum finnmarkense genomovar finnmarkense]MCG8211676.1 hypothetical protein [Tenacibaculum finnmarkense genomovar finnmarkense]
MEKDYFRYYKPKMLLYTIIGLSAIYGTILHYSPNYINRFLKEPYVHYPTASALIILTLSLINKIGLKTYFLKHLFWVKDISGRYKGEITYNHYITGLEEKKDCFLEIEQSASKISVNTYIDFKDDKKSEKTTSKSIVTSIVSDDDFDNQKLVFTYYNSGNTLKGLQPSNGTNILSIIKTDNNLFLEGIYYTDKEPQTKGEIKVEFKSKKIKRKF